MTAEQTNSRFRFQKPAVYKIEVSGRLDESWTDRLGGMQINFDQSNDDGPISVLIGRLEDQSALSGVLNALYAYHVPIISVNMLK